MQHIHDVNTDGDLISLSIGGSGTHSGRGRCGGGGALQDLHPAAQVGHEGVAHLFIEGGGEEFDHVCETGKEGRGEVAIVPQHHEEGP